MMFRTLTLITVFALALAYCPPGRGQDSPSLGDLARKAQKDKSNNNKPSAKVITNDEMSSGSGSATPALGGGPGRAAQSESVGKPSEIQSPAEGLEKLQSVADQLDALDRGTMARNALGGNDVNFPGRANWENKLFAAKQMFVTQIRGLIQRAKQIQSEAEGMKGVQDPNDPRAKILGAKVQQLAQDSVQYSAAFQAVIMEGKDLAAQSAGR